MQASYRLQGASIQLYLLHMRNALLVLPLLVIWLILSRRPALTRAINTLADWWTCSHLTVPLTIAGFFLLTLATALFAYHGIPVVDAVWVMFQTKILALGRLSAPAPQYPEFFHARFIVYDGKWFSYTSPGHSLVLLPGYLLGAPWLTGPLLGTLGIWLLYRSGVRLLGPRSGRVVLLLAVTSPTLIFLFAGYDFHVCSTFFTILAIYLLAGVRRPASGVRRSSFFLAGLCLGMVFLARPYTAVGVGVPLLIYVAVRHWGLGRHAGAGRHAGLPLLFMLGGALLVAVHLAYNWALTGSPLVFPYNLMGKIHGIGFSPDYGEPGFGGMKGHSLARALINTGYQTVVSSLQWLGWPFLSLIFAIPAAFTRRFRRLAWLWLSALGLIVAYFFYWPHGITPWGAKYWSEALPAFIIICALGIRASSALFPRWFGVQPDFARRAVPLLVACSLLVAIPTTFAYLAEGRWGETPKVHRDIAARGLHNAMVFVYTDSTSGSSDYTSAFIYNDPLLKGDIIYARDLGLDQDTKLMKLYPTRSYFLYNYNTSAITPLK
jgi:hypothetical protein